MNTSTKAHQLVSIDVGMGPHNSKREFQEREILKLACTKRTSGVVTSMSKLSVPYLRAPGNTIEIFPDELLDAQYDDVIDLLQAELAPLKTWRRVAVRKPTGIDGC